MLAIKLLSRGGVRLGASLTRSAFPCLSATARPPWNRWQELHSGVSVRQTVDTTSSASPPPRAAAVTVAAWDLQPDTSMLKVRWGTGQESAYPYIWLRDNCQCPACFHPTTLSRRVMLHDLDTAVSPSSVTMSPGGEQLEIQWSDGHLGIYPVSWLQERTFTTIQKEQPEHYKLKQKLWGCELRDKLPRAAFPALLHDDSALFKFFEELEMVGLVVISDVPCHMGQIKKLTERVGYLKTTHYGDTFSVHTKVDTNNLAYTNSSLDLHCDLPFLEEKPGIQLLHCISQFPGEGGDTLMADAFFAAHRLRSSHPQHYRILTQTPVDFIDVGVEDSGRFYALNRVPIIQLDSDGNIKTINLNQMVRDSRFRVTPEDAVAWYKALLTLRDLLYDPQGLVKFKLQAGEMMVFDNLRVMHGRVGYGSTSPGERSLEGAYWDWDEVRSRRRVLRQEK